MAQPNPPYLLNHWLLLKQPDCHHEEQPPSVDDSQNKQQVDAAILTRYWKCFFDGRTAKGNGIFIGRQQNFLSNFIQSLCNHGTSYIKKKSKGIYIKLYQENITSLNRSFSLSLNRSMQDANKLLPRNRLGLFPVFCPCIHQVLSKTLLLRMAEEDFRKTGEDKNSFRRRGPGEGFSLSSYASKYLLPHRIILIKKPSSRRRELTEPGGEHNLPCGYFRPGSA